MCRTLFACLNLFLLTNVLTLPVAQGEEIVILNVNVNQINYGEFFLFYGRDDRFLIKMTDLLKMGFQAPQGETVQIEGEPYVDLGSLSGVDFHLDEKTLTLNIVAQPDHFEKHIINLRAPREEEVLHPKETSAFLNYALNYTSASSEKTFEGSTRLAARTGDYLFVNDSLYRKSGETQRFFRLMTHLTYDNRAQLERTVIGDFIAPSGENGNRFNMGGISFQKIYLMDPHFVKHPTQDFVGSVLFPTTMEIILDGVRIRQENLPPGEFELRNLSHRTGAGFSEIILTDPFGNRKRITQEFYLSNRLLKKGLNEYGYSMGFLREGFGEKNFQYGNPTLSGFHRYGLNRRNTIGLRIESTEDRYLLGPSLSTIIPPGGVLTASMSNSRNLKGKLGLSGTLAYQYQSRRFSGQVLFSGSSRDFTNDITREPVDPKRFEAAIGTGFNPKSFGSMTFNYSYTNRREGFDRQIISAGYSKNIWKNIAFLSSFRWVKEDQNRSEFLLALHYSPVSDISISARYKQVEESRSESIQVQKNRPVGEGVGGRISYERSDSEDRFETFGEYKARYGTLNGGYISSGNHETVHGSLAGALTYTDASIRPTRPIRDSFALVEVDGIEGVRVYQNGQEIGKTDSRGKLLVPDLNSFFDNQITINDRDIPLDYSFPKVSRYLSPPLMSGSLLEFKAERFQAFTGRIKIKIGQNIVPVEFYGVTIIIDAQPISFQTTQDGEFYLENLEPGTYEAEFEYLDSPCAFQIDVPPSDEIIVDLGAFVCEP